jgi:hypothetical protein
MLSENWNIVGAILIFFGAGQYLLQTLKGEAQPNRVSWLIWTIAPLIAFFSEIKQGVGLQSLLTFMVGFMPLLILLASFVNKKAYWKISRFDLFCGGLAVVGLILWQVTKVGNIAILFSVLADLIAGVPTIAKSFTYPESEEWPVYAAVIVAAILTLLTIRQWNFETYAFPIEQLALCLLLTTLIIKPNLLQAKKGN